MANGPAVNATGNIVPVVAPKYALPAVLADGSTGEGVQFVRADLVTYFPHYELVSDCNQGSTAVKVKKETYLPHPDPRALDAVTRYASYIKRAMFYPVTRRTLKGLIGQVFLRDPLIKLPASIAQMEKDTDGAGLSLIQFAKKVEEYVISLGRCGILADFPTMQRNVSRAEILNGTVKPTLVCYDPRDVRNWRTISHNGRHLLSLVVIAEQYEDGGDQFKPDYKVQFRVLKLSSVLKNRDGSTLKNEYSVEIWRKEGTSEKYALFSTSYPRNNAGLPLEEIPFTFVGAEDNSPSVDYPPLFDIADVNISHYRNSAEYEESAFLVGQPTPWASGITESWAKEVLKGELQIGSRGLIMLPENGQCGMLQAEPNTMIDKLMEAKERQMVALGAKLVEQREVQRTAKEAGQEAAAETSILASTAVNTANAIKWALEWCAIFAGAVSQNQDANSEAVEFKLNTEYELSKLSPEDLKAVMSAWQSGALTDEEFRVIMIKSGMATVEFKEWLKEREEKDLKAMADLEAQSAIENGNGLPGADDE